MTGPCHPLDPALLLAEADFVRRLARGLLFGDDRDQVDDVVQDTWLAALRSPPGGGSRGALRAWLSTVVRRHAADQLRSRTRRRRRERVAARDEEPLPSVDDALAREEQRRAVVDALAALAEPYRSAVALRYLEGLEPGEIAARQRVPAATVRTRVHRGLEQMREHLDRRSGGDRRAWRAALLPLATARPGAATGVAMTSMTLASIAMMKSLLLGAAAALCAALLFVFAWPAASSPAPVPRSGDPTVGTVPLAAAPAGDAAVAARSEALPSADRAGGRPAPAAAEVGGYRGRLLDPAGVPLPGAAVRLVALDGARLFLSAAAAGGLVTASARTDADGRFELRDLPRGADCALLADADGELRQLVPLDGSVAGGASTDLGDLQLAARGAVEGIVLGPDGEPLAGVEVLGADLPAVLLTALPVHRFAPAQGAVIALPRAAAFHDVDTYQRELRRALARLGLEHAPLDAAREQVVALDAAQLAPLWNLLPIARDVSGPDGRFRLGGLVEGDNLVVARAPGVGVAYDAGVRVTPGVQREAVELRVKRGEVAYGRVVDADDRPVGGAEVRVAAIGALGFRGVAPCEPAVRTAADGTFEVGGLERGPVLAIARRSADETWAFCPVRSVDEDLEIVLPAAVAVRALVRVPDGIDVAGLRIAARPTPPLGELLRFGTVGGYRELAWRALADGALQCGPLTAGTWTLRFELPGCAPVARCAELPLAEPLSIDLQATWSQHIAVRTATGEPVDGALVFVQDARDLDALRTLPSSYGLPMWTDVLPRDAVVRSDATGEATLADCPPGLRIHVRAPAHGVAFHTVTDADRERTIELRLAGVGSIEGAVRVGPASPRGPGAYRVVVSPAGFDGPDGPPPPEGSAGLDASGRFRFDELPVGRYAVELFDATPGTLTLRGLVDFVETHASVFGRPDPIAREVVELAAPGTVARVGFDVDGADPTRGFVTGHASIDGRDAAGFTIWRRDRQPFGAGDPQAWFDYGWEKRVSATLDAHGDFTVLDLEPGAQWLGLRDGSDGEFVHVWCVDVAAGAGVRVDAAVRLGAVGGVLLRADGRPAASAQLTLSRADVSSAGPAIETPRLARADAAGRFRFDAVPAGRWLVSAYAPTFALSATPVEVFAGDATPPLELRGEDRYEVTLRLADDVPLAEDQGFGVQMAPVGGGASTSSYGFAREVSFPLQSPGRYSLRLWIGGAIHACEPAEVELTELRTELVVRPGAVLGDR
ncbi:MAG: sigma-70 family RNA polymerase sigma factor [Planctomycetes bacterium]|nr:sigma-70 family RNA polymerase sigma factor [Planctomycetota bacterium]